MTDENSTNEPKETAAMTDAGASPDVEPEAEQQGADVVPIHGGEIEHATGHMQVGGLTIDRGLLARTICHDLNDDELDLFIAVCNRTGLDPFAKQIYAIKRNDRNAPGGKKMGVQTSIDGFRLIAERSGRYAGQEPIMWCGPDKEWTDVWLDDEHPPVAARAGVYKAGFAEVLRRTATWTQYVQLTNDGKPTSMWKKMGPLMLGKCAEALALRAAFPAELSGLYTDDEMQQAEYVGARGGRPAIAATSSNGDDVADPDLIADVFLRIAALPDDLRAELRTTWGNVEKIKGVPLRALPARSMQLVQSLLRGVETKAEKVDGWVAQEQYDAKRTELARGVVVAVAGRALDAVSEPHEAAAATADEPDAHTAAAPAAAAGGDDSAAETDDERAERARAVAADAGMVPASTLLDRSGTVEVTEAHLFPLTAPAPVEPDDTGITERMSEAQLDVVIDYVKALDMVAVNKGLRAHEVKLAGAADNVRRQRLVLAILREIERDAAGEA